MEEGAAAGEAGEAGEAGGPRLCLHDSYVLDQATVGVSDHAPVGLVLRLPAGRL